MATKGAGKLETMSELYKSLDADFKAEIEKDVSASCLFKLLQIPATENLNRLVTVFL